jgi:hypothetical protein
MNKELETIIENEFDCLISELGCLMGDEWKAESIKKVVNQAFSLHAVSHQREQLSPFCDNKEQMGCDCVNKCGNYPENM